MSKEEILSKWGLLNDSLVTWQKEDVYKCMQEFADQETFRYLHMEQQVVALLSVMGCNNIIEVIEMFNIGKVAVAFAEWIVDDEWYYNIGDQLYESGNYEFTCKSISDLYQYFINNVYNQ